MLIVTCAMVYAGLKEYGDMIITIAALVAFAAWAVGGYV